MLTWKKLTWVILTWAMRTKIRCLAVLAVFLPGAALGADCRPISFEHTAYTICTVDPAKETLRLFLNKDNGTPLGTFTNLQAAIQAQGGSLAFAMNAGMYHADRAPVGLYVEDYNKTAPLVTRAGPGNFGMLPNGVLCLSPGKARVFESRRFAREAPTCQHATQSGPMLVIDGTLHPRFLPDSTSFYVRNGVGIDHEGKAQFVISEAPVTFHEFARLFRDRLNCPQALYFDGNISKLHSSALNRSDPGFPMGPMIGVIE